MVSGCTKDIFCIRYTVIAAACVAGLHLGVELKVPCLGVLAAVIPRYYSPCLAVGVEPHRPPRVALPVAVLIGNLVLADVVHLGIDGSASLVGEIGGESLCHILAVCTPSEVGIHVPLRLVLLLYL